MRFLVKWYRSGWLWIDLAALGGATVSAVLYATYCSSHSTGRPAAIEFWPGITTDLYGAWLSVRVIDFLIKRRDRKSEERWRVMQVLLYVRDLTRYLSPTPNLADLAKLRDEVDFFHEGHNVAARKKYLSADEQGDVDAVIAAAKTLVRGCEAVIQLGVALSREQQWLDEHSKELYNAEEPGRPYRELLQSLGSWHSDIVRSIEVPERPDRDAPEDPDPRLSSEALTLARRVQGLHRGLVDLLGRRRTLEAAAKDLDQAIVCARRNILDEEEALLK